MDKKTVMRVVEFAVGVFGLVAPLIADAMAGERMAAELDERIDKKVNEVLKEKGV